MGPGALSGILSKLPKFQSENLLVGFDSSDDAAVYKVRDDLAIVQTVDFFPPIVDDPYTFGQIAATNSLSDVYAMGSTPATAMNLICFPSCLPIEIMGEIMQGGYSKVKEAGAIIAGGHTIEDEEPKYGLCVTGFIHPKDVLTNSGCREGDLLILTKALGTGILSTAAKADLLSPRDYQRMVQLMTTLNAKARDAMMAVGANACTDVTGFGLLGHAFEMADGSKKTIELYSKEMPIVPTALELAREGIIPSGAYSNRGYLEEKITVAGSVPLEVSDVLADPQTAGGLLISLPESKAKELLSRLSLVTEDARIVGQVLPYSGKSLIVK